MRIHWVPGWASDFRLFEEEIERRTRAWSDCRSVYVPYSALLRGTGARPAEPIASVGNQGAASGKAPASAPPASAPPAAPEAGDIIVAWSLGALRLPQLFPDLDPEVRLLLVNPALCFTHPDVGWPATVVKMMRRKLGNDRGSVLRDFAERMGFAPPGRKEAWLRWSDCCSTEELDVGLGLLEGEIDRSFLAGRRVLAFFGEDDTIVRPETARLFPELDAQIVQGAGHWPAFEAIFRRIDES